MSNSSIQPPSKLHAQSQRIWQGDRPRDGGRLRMLWLRLRQFFWGGLLLAALALFAWLIWLLLLAPKRTPLVVLTAAPYSWPLPPNAMAHEDFAKFAELDRATISLQGVDRPVLKAEDFFVRLDQELKTVGNSSPRLPMIIWVSLHGVAEPQGTMIHLIPPNASPTDPESWIDFERLMDRLSAIDPQRNVLLVLDCCRMQVNWNIGLLDNPFAERVQTAIRRRAESGASSDRLAVMLSSGTDQASSNSADLGGSLFGHYFQLGLAGDADRSPETGDGDGWVDVQELFRYLESHVRWWSSNSRGRPQTPLMLAAAQRPNFRLVRSLNQHQLADLTNRHVASRQSPLIPAAQLDALWRSLDDLRSKQLYQAEPIAFRDLEHDLLWLEQLSIAGQGYRTLAQRTLDRVQDRFRTIDDRFANLEQQRTFMDRQSVISGSRPSLPRGMRVHSLPLAQYFGLQNVLSASQIRNQLQSLAAQPDSTLLSQVNSELQASSKTKYSTTHWLQMMDRYQTPQLWTQRETLGQWIQSHLAIEDLATPRDRTGMPTDLRAHAWNRSLVDAIDASRRVADDHLFLNDPLQLAESCGATDRLYQQSIHASEQISQALSILDTAFAVTPYYAQWMLHPDRVGTELTADRQIENKLIPLIHSSRQLAAKLADRDDQDSDQTETMAAIESIHEFAVGQIESELETIANDWNSEMRRTLTQSNSDQPSAVGQLQALLTLPMIDWNSRRELRSAIVALETRIHQNLEPWPGVPSANPDPPGPGYTATIRSLSVHPFDLLISSDVQNAEQPTSNRIATFCRVIADQSRAWLPADSTADKRKRCVESANRLRAAAAIWFPPMNPDPLQDLVALDLQSLLLWHGNRIMQDCWGPAGDGQAFFDLAASDYLSTVAQMDRRFRDPSDDSIVSADLRNALTRLNDLRQLMPKWMVLTADRPIQFDAADDVLLKLEINTDDKPSVVPPNGIATLMIRSEQGRIDIGNTHPSAAVTLPSRNALFTARFPAVNARTDSNLKAMSVFRGHEYSGSLDIERFNGITVDIKPHRYDKSQVTLNGPWDSLSVVFVIDCSASMGDPVSGSVDSDSQGDSAQGDSARIEVAKTAIQEILFQLSMRRNVRVGVLAFGNRLGWSVDEPVRALARPDHPGLIDPSVTPDQDVETLLSLGDFDLTAAKDLVPVIGNLKPWGQSPLYVSVAQALQNFSAADSNSERHVIVITDGANYQFSPPTASRLPPTTDDDVRQVWSGIQVPVHILGFGMDQDRQSETVRTFDRLSRDTGGRFHALGHQTDLAKVMRDLLAPGTYQLLALQRDQQPEISVSLGTPTQVIPAPRHPEMFGLQYEGRSSLDGGAVLGNPLRPATEPIVLEGGEAYQLYINHTGTQIFDFPFDENVAAMSELVRQDGSSSDHVVRFHRPSRDAVGQTSFPISWQHREPQSRPEELLWRATRRPSKVWIQLQPIGTDGKPLSQDYVYYDAAFEPNQTVPLLNVVAHDWPANAVKARISLWSQPPREESTIELLPPAMGSGSERSADRWSTTLPHSQLTQTESADSAVTVSVTDGVTVHWDPIGTRFDEGIAKRRYVVTSSDPMIPVSSIKLEVDDATSERLTRKVRQYDASRGIALHTFYYESRNNDSPTEITVSNQTHEIENSWRLDGESIEIAIPESGGLLPIGR